MRTTIGLALLLAACGTEKRREGNGGDAAADSVCMTSVSGTVYAPNGTLPLYGVNVYVPNSDPGPIPDGADVQPVHRRAARQSDRARRTTDEHGHFSLDNIPVGDNIPVVITIGKWRRIITHPAGQRRAGRQRRSRRRHDAAEEPRRHVAEHDRRVDMPKIAITTGSADSLECLVRKLGIADKEITDGRDAGHVHLYAGNGVAKASTSRVLRRRQRQRSRTRRRCGARVDGKLTTYDIVILSCEGAQNPQTKPQAAIDTMKMYADMGGRVFLRTGTTSGSRARRGTAEWSRKHRPCGPSIATFDDGGARSWTTRSTPSTRSTTRRARRSRRGC